MSGGHRPGPRDEVDRDSRAPPAAARQAVSFARTLEDHFVDLFDAYAEVPCGLRGRRPSGSRLR